MKKMLLILLIAPIIANAQNSAPLNIGYFPSTCNLSVVDSFNKYILESVEGYHLLKMDSTTPGSQRPGMRITSYKWDFVFTNNQTYNGFQDNLEIIYSIEAVSGNPSLHIPISYGISDIVITGEFLTLAKVYNKIFNANIDPQTLQAKKSYGPIHYNGKDKNYWFNLDTGMSGWAMAFRKR